ncbi:HAUS augmin-like complex subunit 6 N-terminus-domain-containing protein [Catenaria anguillulae PL171]|uniref:HAUS augmin-like complex subunit 6 N-terminus-domain-containing protein n=1 Tax=Catenaria anguillulae PL171 TaxID=765915 RepID=A0A1Y2HD88_9FUNG|nr:HAUS augmin-like complex subunit 6 N-terminus-domain-containing protein [Catenaria anguillulae PL171]
MSTSDPTPPPPGASALAHLTTNLHLLRFPHASSLSTLSLATSANHRATDAILVFLFQHIDPQRARTTFRPLLALTSTDPGARRSFRAATYAWLDELKHMFPGPVLLRKSVLDDGKGERFIEVLASLAFHAVRCVLARADATKANEVAALAAPLQRVPGGELERRARALVDEYRDMLTRDVAVRQSCASLAEAYTRRLGELDEEWARVAQHLVSVDAGLPSTTTIRDQLVRAHQELGDEWSRLAAAVPWEPARDLVRLALDPHHKRAELSIPTVPEASMDPAGAQEAVDWTQLATAAARTLTECAKATASSPVDANSISERAAHVARLADEAEDRCARLQSQVDAARAKVEALEQPQPMLSAAAAGSDPGFPIRLREYPKLDIRPQAPPEVLAKAVSKTWDPPPLVVPPPSMSHPRTLASQHSSPGQSSRKRPASSVLSETENMNPSLVKPPRLRQSMGPPATLPAHHAAREPKRHCFPAEPPFTPHQHPHRGSSVTLVSTPTSATTSSIHRPPAIWTMSPIRPSPLSPPPPPPPHTTYTSIVDVPCGASRRVSFTLRPLEHVPAHAHEPSTLSAMPKPRSSRRSTDVHRMIVDQMLDDAHAPLSPAPRPSTLANTLAAALGDVSWSTPGRPSDCFRSSMSTSFTSHRMSGAELAHQWFASPGTRSPSVHASKLESVVGADMDVSFDLDAFVNEHEGMGNVVAIGDEELPQGASGRVGDKDGEDGEVGEDSLLMMMQS